ncbi:hypothetical protein [Geopsychrobacter electrodiphilus]|uniref:hypothetical protein n=1 Tax=Geopsychrobacter electrodiphilus TaxID=225196 RepID=UPI00036AB234|nr:hypothetical protein [Geopsychrobacter electrodiphilus]
MRLFCILILLLPACAPATNSTTITPAQHRLRATAMISVQDIPGALKEMQQAITGNPNVDDALLYGDLLESTGKYKEARRVYKKAFTYPSDNSQKQTLSYHLALLEAVNFDNLKTAENLAQTLPTADSRLFDLKSVILLKQGQFKPALNESQRALSQAKNNEEKGWANFHMAQIYFKLRLERETFRALFEAVNYGRGHSLVARITNYWEDRRNAPFPKN